MMIDLLALATFAQSIDIDKILCSTSRKLCNQEILSRDKGLGQIIVYLYINSPAPYFIKFNASYFRSTWKFWSGVFASFALFSEVTH